MPLLSPRVFLDRITPHWLLARLSIASKMLLGYLLLVLLSLAVVMYVLASLLQLNKLENGIIRVDVPVREAADSMLDTVLAQDFYEKRYLILMRKDVRGLFWQRGAEFDARLASLKALPNHERFPLDRLAKLHRQYGDLFLRETKLVMKGSLDEASALSKNELRSKTEEIAQILKTMVVDARRSQDGTMKNISRLGSTAIVTTVALCVVSIVVGLLAGLAVTNHISSSIGKLKEAASRVAEGDFYTDPHIEAQDEIGDLSEAFRRMGQRLGRIEEMYLDASPLTRLPGGLAIEHELKRRIEAGQPLAFCMLDLDNFKAFNDHYGYAHGNDVIKETARVIEDAVKAEGSPGNFVGHIGGDDFVVITTPKSMRAISDEIIKKFDECAPRFYNEQDRDNGFILGKTRDGKDTKFPILTISIAIVTNVHRKLSSTLEVSEIAAEIKDHAKTIDKSVYIVDKRRAG